MGGIYTMYVLGIHENIFIHYNYYGCASRALCEKQLAQLSDKYRLGRGLENVYSSV